MVIRPPRVWRFRMIEAAEIWRFSDMVDRGDLSIA